MLKAKLTEGQFNRLKDAAYSAYNAIGPEAGWEQKTPSKATFFDVVEDIMWRDYLSKPDRDLWDVTSKADRRRIIFSVGP